MLLRCGAGTFVNELCEPYMHHFFTPFTAAMHQQGYDPIPLLNLLLHAGAIIHGPEIEAPMQSPMHIPVFVAVKAMATTGDTTLLDWCLLHGANINHRAPVEDQGLEWMRQHPTAGYYYYTNPALFYVHSIDSWDYSEEIEGVRENPRDEWGRKKKPGKKLQNPLQGLIFLLDRGGDIDPALDGCDRRTRKKNDTWAYPNLMAPWCLERLLRSWGLAKLQESPNYRMMVNYLLRRSVQRGDIAEMLVRCEFALRADYIPWAYQYKSQSKSTVRFWVELVDKLLLPDCRPDPTRILAEYIVCKGRRLDALQEIGRATIDRLLAAGADINTRVADDGSTSLHQLCREYNTLERGDQRPWFSRRWPVRKGRLDFVRYLLSKGADPSLTVHGSTPRELLLANVRRDGQ